MRLQHPFEQIVALLDAPRGRGAQIKIELEHVGYRQALGASAAPEDGVLRFWLDDLEDRRVLVRLDEIEAFERLRGSLQVETDGFDVGPSQAQEVAGAMAPHDDLRCSRLGHCRWATREACEHLRHCLIGGALS